MCVFIHFYPFLSHFWYSKWGLQAAHWRRIGWESCTSESRNEGCLDTSWHLGHWVASLWGFHSSVREAQIFFPSLSPSCLEGRNHRIEPHCKKREIWKDRCRKTIFISVKTHPLIFGMPRLCWHGSIIWLPAFMLTSKALFHCRSWWVHFGAPKKSHWWDFWQVCTMASMRSGMWGCMKKSSTVCIEDPGFDLFEIGWSVTMVRHCAPWCTGLKTGDLIIDGFQELWLYLTLTRLCSHGPIRNCLETWQMVAADQLLHMLEAAWRAALPQGAQMLLTATMEHAVSSSDLPRMDELDAPFSGIQSFLGMIVFFFLSGVEWHVRRHVLEV